MMFECGSPVVPIRCAELVDEDGVSAAQQVGVLLLDLAEDAYPQTRPREWMAVDHLMWQTERNAQLAHFVLEQFAQWFEELEIQCFRQTTDVVMTLDGVRFLGLAAGRFNHIRINRPLGEPFCVRQLLRFELKHLDKLASDDLAFSLRIGDAFEMSEELLRCVHMNDLDAQIACKRLHDLLRLVQSEQSVINKHTGQLIPDRPMQQRGNHRRIDTAGQAEDDFFATDLRPYLLDRLIHIVRHVPVMPAAANVVHEAGEHLLALDGVRDFRVKLDCVETARLICHACDRAGITAGDDFESSRQRGDLVTVTHPHVEQPMTGIVATILDSVEKLGVPAGTNFCVAELALARTFDRAAKLLRHRLHAVANAENGNTKLKYHLRRAPLLCFVN
jgi:hypothetical protein